MCRLYASFVGDGVSAVEEERGDEGVDSRGWADGRLGGRGGLKERRVGGRTRGGVEKRGRRVGGFGRGVKGWVAWMGKVWLGWVGGFLYIWYAPKFS